MRLALGVTLLALALGACTSTDFNRAATAPDYPPWRGDVAVLDTLPPAGQYERLGVVVVEGGDVSTAGRLVSDLKKAAAKQGANAIMLQRDKPNQETTRGVGTSSRMAAWAFRLR